MGDQPSMRVSDADRQETAERLRLAHDEGRLSLSEYDTRLRSAYAATVRGELDVLTDDLPVARRDNLPSIRAQNVEVEKADAKRAHLAAWRSWGGVAVILSAIWLVTALASDDWPFFWPIFPLGIWGAVLLANSLFWKKGD